MSKRRIEKEISETSEEILGGLTPDERLKLWLEGAAAGNDDWVERLRETCPTHTYRATDLAFVDRGKAAVQFLQHAVYVLHTTYLHHELLDQHRLSQIAVDLHRDDEPSPEDLDRAEQRADEITQLFIELYGGYYGYRRFATEELNVELETWFELHPEGADVLELVTDRLEEERRLDRATEVLTATAEAGGNEDGEAPDPITLDDVVDVRYQSLASMWEEALATTP